METYPCSMCSAVFNCRQGRIAHETAHTVRCTPPGYVPRYVGGTRVAVLDRNDAVIDLALIVDRYDLDHWSVTPTFTHCHIVEAKRLRVPTADDYITWLAQDF